MQASRLVTGQRQPRQGSLSLWTAWEVGPPPRPLRQLGMRGWEKSSQLFCVITGPGTAAPEAYLS